MTLINGRTLADPPPGSSRRCPHPRRRDRPRRPRAAAGPARCGRPRRRLLLEERPDRRRRLRAGAGLQPGRAEPDLRAHRHRWRLPLEPGRAELGAAARLGGPRQMGLQRRAEHRRRPARRQPGVRGRRHVHQQLGPQQRCDCALVGSRGHLADHRAAVQERRQHAGARHGRAAGGRPGQQPQCLLRRRGRQRAVAQHRLRRYVGQGDRVPQRRHLRAGPERRQRLPEPEPGLELGDVRRQHGVRGCGRQAEPGLPQHQRRHHLGTDPRSAHRIPGTQGRGAGQVPVPRHQRHRRAVRRRRRAGPAPRHHHRHVDRHQPGPGVRLAVLRLFGPDRGPPAPRHADGGHAELVVAGCHLLPQHRLRRHVDPDLGLHQLSERVTALHHGHRPGSVAGLQHQPAAAGDHPEAGLDERVGGDRPVRLQPPALRHRRHRVRHHAAHQLGQQHHVHDQADGQGHRGDRRPGSGQPAVRRPAGQRARRHRRLLSRRSERSAAELPRHPEPGQQHQPRLRRSQPAGLRPRRQRRGSPAHRDLQRRRQELVPGSGTLRRHRRRHHRGRRGRHRLRLVPRRHRRALLHHPGQFLDRLHRHPGRRESRIGPQRPKDLLRVRRQFAVRQPRRWRHVHDRCRAHRHAAHDGGSGPHRRCLAGRCGRALPLHHRRVGLHEDQHSHLGNQRGIRQGGTGRELPGRVPGRRGRRRGRRVPLRRRGRLLGADQRRAAPVRQLR